MLNRRQFVALSSAALASLALPLRAQPALTLWGPPVTPTALLAVAAKHGKTPFAVNTWRTPDQLRAGLVNGDIGASIVPSYVAANLYNQGRKVKLYNIMTEGLLYLGAREALSGLDALPGKKLVIPFKNDMPDLVLQALCKKQGIDFTKIDVQYTATPPEALLLFLSGKADCALLPEPVMSMAEIKSKESGKPVLRALDLQTLWGSTFGRKPVIPQAGLCFTDAFIAENANFIAGLDAALEDALARTLEDPMTTATLVADLLPFPAPVLAKAIPHSHFATTRAAAIKDDIRHFFSELHALNAKITGGKIPDADLFYRA
ncbi:MAG: ABC transporter substrate-binding protein [Cardiobacteriaceae bacterium]|nr:ABC transporter substrate-binding protein [Cardiobacteriaceae bacterium]